MCTCWFIIQKKKQMAGCIIHSHRQTYPISHVVSIACRYALRKYRYILAKTFWMGRGISLHFRIDGTSPTSVREVRRDLTKKCKIEVATYELMLKAALTNNSTYSAHTYLSVFLCTVNGVHPRTYTQDRRMTPS